VNPPRDDDAIMAGEWFPHPRLMEHPRPEGREPGRCQIPMTERPRVGIALGLEEGNQIVSGQVVEQPAGHVHAGALWELEGIADDEPAP
jgi:hypothetical protein